ncbi:MAG: hypothetical protein ACRDJP_01715 [Actinomycetota bacterium]
MTGEVVPIRRDVRLPAPDRFASLWKSLAAQQTARDADLVDRLLADMRDAAGQLELLDGPAREVGRWLRGRVQAVMVDRPPMRR